MIINKQTLIKHIYLYTVQFSRRVTFPSSPWIFATFGLYIDILQRSSWTILPSRNSWTTKEIHAITRKSTQVDTRQQILAAVRCDKCHSMDFYRKILPEHFPCFVSTFVHCTYFPIMLLYLFRSRTRLFYSNSETLYICVQRVQGAKSLRIDGGL